MNLPRSIQERAALIYRKALEKDLVRGRSISAITSASLYAACRLSQFPRTLKEIAEASALDKKDREMLPSYYTATYVKDAHC